MTTIEVSRAVDRLNNNIQGGKIRYYYLGKHGNAPSVAFDFEGGYAVYTYREATGEFRLNTIFDSDWRQLENFKKVDVGK
jgi:hypothetical protein